MLRILKRISPLFALVLVACVSTSPQKIVFDTTEEPIQSWYIEAKADVEQQLNVDLSQVVFSIVDGEELKKYYEKSARNFAKQHFHKKFHSEIIEDSVDSNNNRTIALYDRRTKAIMVSKPNFERYVKNLKRHGFSSQQAALPIIYHELVHAADDVLLDFKKMRKNVGGSHLALSAVIEGHAQFVSRELCKKSVCANAFERASDIFMLTDAKSHKLSIFDSSADNTELKYVEGEQFLNSLFSRGGDELLLFALKNPPRKVIQLFAPDQFPDNKRESSSKVLQDALLSLQADWINDDWITFSDNTIDGESFSKTKAIRANQISSWISEVSGSAKVEYYNQGLDELEPIRITLYELATEKKAEEFAKRQYQRAYMNSGSVIGSGLKLKNFATEYRRLDRGYRQDLQADVLDPDDGSVFPFGTTILQSGNLVAQILSYRPVDEHDRVVVATQRVMNGLL